MRLLLVLSLIVFTSACGVAASPERDAPVAKLFRAIHSELDAFDGRDSRKDLTSAICGLVDEATVRYLLDNRGRYADLKIMTGGDGQFVNVLGEGEIVLSYVRSRLLETKELRIAVDSDGTCWAGAFQLSVL